MRIASDLAGFTMGEADVLRKAMGKKDATVMQAQRDRFVQGAVERGIAKRKATKIFDLIEYFAGYGFNKSHSTTYALLAYQTAYLKANFPWHFMAALLTIERQNTDKLAIYLGECRDMSVPILPPDVNASGLGFTVTDDGIRFGLTAIKNVGEAAIASIVKARGIDGAVRSLNRLCEDVDLRLVNKRVLESLTKAGAFDALLPADPPLAVAEVRARVLAAIDPALEHGSRRQRDRERGQTELFGESEAGDTAGESLRRAPVSPWSETQQLAFEKEALGLYLSGHPVDRYAGMLRTHRVKRVEELTEGAPSIAVAGIIASRRSLTTRKGSPMAVVTLEDRGGSLEAVVFPDAFGKYGSLLETDALVVARGRLEKDDETARLIVSEVSPLTTLGGGVHRMMAIRLAAPPHGRETLEALAEVFGRHQGDDQVSLEIELRRRQQPVRLRASLSHTRIRGSEALVEEIERLCGKGAVSWVS